MVLASFENVAGLSSSAPAITHENNRAEKITRAGDFIFRARMTRTNEDNLTEVSNDATFSWVSEARASARARVRDLPSLTDGLLT